MLIQLNIYIYNISVKSLFIKYQDNMRFITGNRKPTQCDLGLFEHGVYQYMQSSKPWLVDDYMELYNYTNESHGEYREYDNP